jgi:hypothetical protein
MRLVLLAAFAVALIVDLRTASAGWPCSIDHAYPEVAELRIDDDRLVAILGNYFSVKQATERPDGSEGYLLQYPHLSLSVGGKWETEGLSDRPNWRSGSDQSCTDFPLDPEGAWHAKYGELSYQQGAEDYFNQSVTSCASDGRNLWGGISFYGGEGYWGAGGLAKKDLETGRVEFVRPSPQTFIEDSTGPIAYFENSLWMGTSWNGECGGPAPGSGLKKLVHYPSLDHYVAEDVPEVCGFAIRDFQEFDGALWVATELGLSKLVDDDGPQWTNFVPDLEHPGLMRRTTCDDLYVELLQSKRLAETAGFDIGNAFDVFWNRVNTLRPEFATRYLRELHGHPTDDYPRGYE